MTPALLFALEQQYMDDVGVETWPIDKLAWTYMNANRDPGEKDANGVQTRPPAPPLDPELFRTYGHSRLKSLAAKVENWGDPSLYGAQASRASFEAWAGSRLDVEYVPKEN